MKTDLAPNPLTDKHAEEFAAYVFKWQHMLGLQDWRIVISPIRSKGVLAEVKKTDWRQRQATLRLGPDWQATPINSHTLEQTAVHELLHVLLYELIEVSKNNQASVDDLGSVEHRVINLLERLLVPGRE